ncbi:four helix bundle protein [Algiphilus sp. W345]|uniref:Four helix bundle protein n=1 Tax=Banduia mediterranea TaxID=3075609 RepID=A0ABU2WJK9_9GAMM|nr:four helix bundle protein [Algiphilus sp. W345]MDT0497804.1 four helix bundle protein [Algiphilus sp. W345]
MREVGGVRREKRRHHELEVWRDALDLVEMIYQASSSFPSDERFGLSTQIPRAAVSVPSNIAEGAARGTRAELIHFLHMTRGSLSEIDTQWRIARRLGYLGEDEAIDEQLDCVFAKLGGLLNALKKPGP